MSEPKSPVPLATVIIVHYGNVEPTVLLANTVVEFGCDLAIVANDLRTRPPRLDERAKWHVPSRNLGYGDAFTFAARGTRTPALVLMNNDLVVPRRSFSRCLDVLLDNDNVGIVGPVLRFADGRLQSGAARLTSWLHAPGVLTDPGPRVVECTWVTGAIMFIRREVVEQVGIDGSYFLGCEDADLCVRAQRAGWQILCCGDAPVTHHQSQVIVGPTWYYYSVRNRIWFARALFGRIPALLNLLVTLAQTPRVVLADVVRRRNFDATRLVVLGLRHSFQAKPSHESGALDAEPVVSRLLRLKVNAESRRGRAI